MLKVIRNLNYINSALYKQFCTLYRSNVTLKSILALFIGNTPIGLFICSVEFQPFNPYPTALTLPTKYTDYDEFKKHVDAALTVHGVFGLI